MYRYPVINDNTKPYIVTNPPPETVLTDKDIVFVLAPNMPDQTITETWGSPFEGMPRNNIGLNMTKKDKKYEQDFDDDGVSTNSDININIKRKDLSLNLKKVEEITEKIKSLKNDIKGLKGKIETRQTNFVDKLQETLSEEIQKIVNENLVDRSGSKSMTDESNDS